MRSQITELLFDPFFYSHVSGIREEPDLLKHFEVSGAAAGLSPGPFFDAQWYSSTNLDVRDAGIAPFVHFRKFGMREGRAPNPIFDPIWYGQSQNIDVGDAVTHYLSTGWRQGLDPHPLFWADWYRVQQGLEEELDPLTHYLTEGSRVRAAPNPLFDSHYFAQLQMRHLPDTADALAYFIEMARNEPTLSAHPLFDGDYYLSGLKRAIPNPSGSALALYLQSTEFSSDPHPLFDEQFYRRQRKKLTIEPALADYVVQGPSALTDPHPFFCKSFYYLNAPDVQANNIDALVHYLSSGDKERRAFHPLFDPQHYHRNHDFECTALEHYLLCGTKTGASPRAMENPDTEPRIQSPMRRVVSVPFSNGSESHLPSERIGIFAHIFHLECAEQMIAASANVPRGRSTLYISTNSLAKARKLEELCTECSKHPFEIRVTPNRGRDIAPMLVGYSDRLSQVDVGVHIHSKRSLHYAGGFDAWRSYLLHENLGSETIVASILDLLSAPEIGAYVPDIFPGISDEIQWGGNFKTAQALMEMIGEKLDREGTLDMPAGSMFWFRTAALKPLFQCNLTYEHFEPETGQIDGTLAHAIERIFLPVIEAAGYSYIVGKSDASGAGSAGRPAIGLMSNRVRPMQRELGEITAHLPHFAGYLTRPSPTDRPRINLLIPTVDRGKAYAGVSAALDVFMDIRGELGARFDARAIAVDVKPRAHALAQFGFKLTSLDAEDCERIDTLVPGTDRHCRPMNIRKGDVFVATAAWTAHQAQELRRAQVKTFGWAPARHVYLIQDFECGFDPWSTAWALAEATYMRPKEVIPIYNTQMLADYMTGAGYFEGGHILNPPMNREFSQSIQLGTTKEKLVLLYARPHAARNALEFLDCVVARVRSSDPDLWHGWRFLAIGEDFSPAMLKCGGGIEVVGRLSIAEYGQLASRAALAVSLMISPHPSYPPLEMAAAGVRVLVNAYGERDSSSLHANIQSFKIFDVDAVANQLTRMARNWIADPQGGWEAAPLVDWFFDEKSNQNAVARDVANEIVDMWNPRRQQADREVTRTAAE